MADRYWIANGDDSASVAGNWNTSADGGGASGVPAAGDDVYFGHTTSFTNGIGNGACTWDITPTITSLTTYSGYNDVTVTSTSIGFTASSTITNTESDWDTLGFRAGMKITISGATNSANNGTFNILTVSGETLTVSETTLVTESASASVTVSYTTYISVEADFGMLLLTLDSHLKNDSGSSYKITFSGVHDAGGDQRYILNGSNAQISNADDLTYEIDGNANGATATYFDDGPYPAVSITGATAISFGHKSPTSEEFGEVEMYSFTAGSSVTTQNDTTATPRNNQSKVFTLLTDSFTYSPTTFDAGKSTWKFTLDGTFAFPVSDDTQTFLWYNLIFANDGTAGRKATIAAGRTLSVNSLHIEADTLLEGHKTRGEASSTVVSVRRPKILGAWNFSQLSDGVYVSLMETAFPITPADGAADRLQISDGSGKFTSSADLTWDEGNSELTVDGKLTVTGLIDPTGLELAPQSSNPGGVAANTIWINSGDSNRLYYGSSHISGGGGGGGGGGSTVDVVSNVATNTILGRNDSGSGDSEELTPAEVRTMLNVADGATAYADSDAIAAVEGEATLNLTGDVGLADGKYIKWGTDSYIISNASGVDLTIRATDDMFLRATDAIGLRNASSYTMWLTATNRVGVGTTSPAQKLHVVGTIRQTGATSTVLVADSNGDLVAATNLSDQAYSTTDTTDAAVDTYVANPLHWVAPPPTTVAQALDRIAAWANNPTYTPGPIP
jgi:hypothetical protein